MSDATEQAMWEAYISEPDYGRARRRLEQIISYRVDKLTQPHRPKHPLMKGWSKVVQILFDRSLKAQ